MTQRTLDLLIVGQGLAGSLVAHAAHDAGMDFLVVDDGQKTAASLAAAGLMTPYTGRRFSAPVGLPSLLQTARTRYRQLAERLGAILFTPCSMLRVFTLDEEPRRHRERRETPFARELIGPLLPPGRAPAGIADPLGGCEIHGGGRVDLEQLLHRTRNWLRQTNRLLEDVVAHRDLAVHARQCRWRGVTTRHALFCTGHRARLAPWFGNLPWRMSRGEALVLRRTDDMPARIVHAGRTLAPLDDRHLWFGATYGRDLDQLRPDPATCARLLEDFRRILPGAGTPEVLDHQVGIRAGTRPGPPFAGLHPAHPSIGLFDGFGSRGTLLGPWHAEALIRSLGGDQPVMLDVPDSGRS